MNKIKTFMILILALIICISASLVIAIPEYIDPAILEEFETKKKVGMIVKVIDTSSIEISSKGSVEQQRVRDLERKEIFEDKVDAILAELSKSEFELGGTFILGNGFHGSVNRDGFNRLVDHPYVKDIYLEGYTYVSLVESRQLINADDAENLGYTGAGQTACVIDSGIDYDHPDLGGCFGAGCKVRMGWDYVNVDGDPDDDFGHGTHAAGIIASENNTYKGIAPDANLIALKVCNGSGACNNTLTIDALGYCYSLRDAYNISVVSISTGDLQEHLGNCPEWADDEINYLYAVGIPVIVSSGNQGYTNGISYTACSPNAISVGAVYDDALGRQPAVGNYPEAPCYDNDTQVDNVTCYTNRASNLDLLAPGQQMTTTDEGGGYITIGGTSAAAPIVSGAVLLLLQADPTLDVDEIKEILNDTGVPVTREGLTRPRIDIQAAINSLDTVQTFNISNSGSATLNVTSITNNSAWFSYIYPNSFTLNTSSYQLVKVIVNPSGYTPGAYSGIVSVNSDDPDESQVNISVTMNVYCIDNDRDGYDDYDATWCSLGTDCNDTNSSINPVATEICDDGIDNDCDNDVDYNDSDCTEADGESCTYDYQCDSGYCDNDGLGWVDDDHCFSIESTYYDNQDSKCEESARAANSDWCDEKRNEDLNTCDKTGVTYKEDTCSDTCTISDKSIFECNETGCSCTEPLCDGLSTGSNITTCTANQTYFADKCTSIASGEDRDNICRNSSFAADCTADSECNNIEAGTGFCTATCTYIDNPPNVTLVSPLDNNISITGNVTFNCSVTDDHNLTNVTLYHNISGTWLANETSLLTGTSDYALFTINNIPDGNYTWNCLAYDSASQSDWGNSNYTLTITLPTESQILIFKNSLGNTMAYFNSSGNLWVNGNLEQNSSYTRTSADEHIINYNNEDVYILNQSNGNLFIDGELFENQNPLTPQQDSYIIKDDSNNVVAYINSTGNLFLKGELK